MRHSKDIRITAEGRDQGKVFVLTEMPASKAEKWAIRALLAMSRGGVDVSEELSGAGFLGVAIMGIRSLAIGALNYVEMEPLLDEMFRCVSIRPDPDKTPQIVRVLMEEDIEEVLTRVTLRREVLELHMGFSVTALLSRGRETSPKAPTADA